MHAQPYSDVKHLLEGIKGKGKEFYDGREIWSNGLSVRPTFWTGSIELSPVVNIKNDQVMRDKQPIWNILAEIKGIDHMDEKIIVGNHRDAWCFGASDPNSGTAIVLEVARVLGKMMENGWRPKRTIMFVNFDAEEYNLFGST